MIKQAEFAPTFVPCTPITCRGCGYVYHWRGSPEQVRNVLPVEQGLCPACHTGRAPVTVQAKCSACHPVVLAEHQRVGNEA
jgi:hypothetical protein